MDRSPPAASGNLQLWEEGRGAIGYLLCVAEGLAEDVGEQARLDAFGAVLREAKLLVASGGGGCQGPGTGGAGT